MKINEIEISGFKGIQNLIIHPKKINILVGKNNTGKTSILEAINSTLDANTTRMQIKYDPYLSNLININKKESKIVVKLENESRYLLLTKPELKEILPEFKKQVMENIKSIVLSFQTNKNGWEEVEKIFDEILSKGDILSELEKNSIRIEIAGRKTNIFSFTPLMLKEIEPVIEYVNKKFFRGANILIPFMLTDPRFYNPKGIEKSEKNVIFIKILALNPSLSISVDKSTVEKIQNYLKNKKIVESLERFDFDKLLFRDNKKEYEIPYSFMGDGFKSLVGFIAKTSIENKIILIEEPENHMHPAYIKDIIRQIIDFTIENDAQFFIATHSSDVLDAVLTDVLEPSYQEYLSNQLNIIALDYLGGEVITQEFDRKEAQSVLEDIESDLRGNK
jgi:AAA15 family ATPase/GTPase